MVSSMSSTRRGWTSVILSTSRARWRSPGSPNVLIGRTAIASGNLLRALVHHPYTRRSYGLRGIDVQPEARARRNRGQDTPQASRHLQRVGALDQQLSTSL